METKPKTPNEKTIELLFNRFLLQSFRLGDAVLLAPSSRQEFKDAYDVKLTLCHDFHEVVLQFKAPRKRSDGGFTFSCTQHQHRILQQYAPNTAFYIAPAFKDNADLEQAQRVISQASEFLRHYIAIDASALPADTDFVQFQEDSREPYDPRYKCPSDGSIRKAVQPIQRKSWMHGTKLLRAAKKRKVGQRLNLNQIDSRTSTTPTDARIGSRRGGDDVASDSAADYAGLCLIRLLP